jgi:hypothetical protein
MVEFQYSKQIQMAKKCFNNLEIIFHGCVFAVHSMFNVGRSMFDVQFFGRSFLCFIFKPFQICLPFHGKQMFLFGITRFAAGDHIPLGASTPQDQGHHMIHCEFPWRSGPAAIVAYTFCQFALPPLGLPEIPGFVPLPADVVIVPIEREFRHFSTQTSQVSWCPGSSFSEPEQKA